MLIMATFDHSLELEKALLLLEREGIERRGIMVVPLDTPGQDLNVRSEPLPDWKQRAFEVGMALGTACSVVGICVGYVLVWGPLLWGLIAAISGFCTGYGVYAVAHRKQWGTQVSGIRPEAAVIVRVEPDGAAMVRQVLWQHKALSMGIIPDQERQSPTPPIQGGGGVAVPKDLTTNA